MTQDFLHRAKHIFHRNTVCTHYAFGKTLRKMGKARYKKDKSGGVSEVSEEV